MKLNIGLLVQGSLMIRTLTFLLINSVTGAIIEEKEADLQIGGLATVDFETTSGPDFYICIKQKGGGVLTSYTAQTFSFVPVLNINLKDAANKVYGDNQIEIAPGVFALYNGDLFGDDLENGVSAYGDGVLDGSDSTKFINPDPVTGLLPNTMSYADFVLNCQNSVYSQAPTFSAA
jgi:hypothetical protein